MWSPFKVVQKLDFPAKLCLQCQPQINSCQNYWPKPYNLLQMVMG